MSLTNEAQADVATAAREREQALDAVAQALDAGKPTAPAEKALNGAEDRLAAARRKLEAATRADQAAAARAAEGQRLADIERWRGEVAAAEERHQKAAASLTSGLRTVLVSLQRLHDADALARVAVGELRGLGLELERPDTWEPVPTWPHVADAIRLAHEAATAAGEVPGYTNARIDLAIPYKR